MKLAAIFLFVLFSLATVNAISRDKSILNTAECFVCKVLLQESIEELRSNSTSEIDKVLRKACAAIPSSSSKQKCIKMAASIAKFFDKEFLMLINRHDETPETLCTMFNYCPVDCCVSKAPEQVHISLSGDSITSMMVSWVTAKSDSSQVLFGLNPSSLSQSVSGSNYTYTSGGWNGVLHKAEMSGLAPNTKYFYKVGGNKYGFSPVFSFRTFPASSSSFKFAVIGDMGADPQAADNIRSLTNLVQSESIDVLIHSGDISYADGYQARWDQYLRMIQPIAANLPYMVCPGNHEIMPLNAMGLYGYKYRFLMPGAESGSNSNTFYSWNYGPVHFIALNAESELEIAEVPEKQIQWLVGDLKKVDRKERPWIVVYLHRPIYCTNEGKNCELEAAYLRSKLERIFLDYRVNLVITAHMHDYERTKPVFNTKVQNDSKAPVYIVNGAGGNRESIIHFPSFAPDWSAFRLSERGYGIIEASNSTLVWEFHLATNQTLIDRVTLPYY
eukprot:TRINITY_DN9149_c0_g1_i1.p1 TRINITY_DN9149_c0_g1~~TRINITY_DN9149_c0_g1_i1.p1  ORF type:complete len:501 (-),score=116.23 TRINITY_DN9149_c0_g1_i1:61-1563(-)